MHSSYRGKIMSRDIRDTNSNTNTDRNSNTDNLLGNCSDALRYALNRGADNAEVYAETIEQKKVSIASDRIETVQQLERRGMGIRVFTQKGMAFASVNALTGPRLKSVIEDSLQLASRSPYYCALPDQDNLPVINLYDPELSYIELEDIGDYAQHLVDSVKICNTHIQVDSGMVLVTIHRKAIATSKGIEASDISSIVVWELLGAASDGISVSDFDYQCEGTHWRSKICIDEAAHRLANTTVPALRARTCSHFTGEVILAPGAVSFLAYYVAEAANASMVEKGVSALTDSLQTAVASPCITLYDDALLSKGLASASFDREGVPHRTLPLIEKGILTSFLHDATTASHAQCKSTGHAAGGYRSRPEIESTNLVIPEGRHTIDDVIADVRHGILISRLSGTPDILTGEFSLAVKNCITISKGELSEPVKGLIFSGNLYTILSNVSEVSRTSFPLGDGHCPYILLTPQRLTGSNSSE
jgi:PmbA protein